MKQALKKMNPIDMAVLAIVILLVVLAFFTLTSKKKEEDRSVELTLYLPTSQQSELIYSEALKLGGVYLNSVNEPVKVVRVNKQAEYTDIVLLGKGKIEEGKYIFNGQRVLVGQKAEIHASYFAQGYIKSARYAD